VLVYHDIVGLENRFKPKFVRRYGTAFDDQVAAISSYASDVRQSSFPGDDETYHAGDGLVEALGLYGGNGN
jgi:3-methyl-2-oxobutanoate hydroxymethyltransferase